MKKESGRDIDMNGSYDRAHVEQDLDDWNKHLDK